MARVGAALIAADEEAKRRLGMRILRWCAMAFVLGIVVGVPLGWWWFG